MNEVLPKLDELLFSSVEGVLVESVEVTDTVVRVEARTTAGRAACPGCGCWSGTLPSPTIAQRRQATRTLVEPSPASQSGSEERVTARADGGRGRWEVSTEDHHQGALDERADHEK
ncbi:hypothetical protein [Streptomyces sp. NPDC059010]|uniref:hypothetical protein n=1 Tax=Streptomyces sp. NPDC059010 TaxID=3346695 RepID=UPI0036993667